MTQNPKMQLSRLRDIGWSVWDPIALRDMEDWKDGAGADEYDGYLLHVASLLRRGAAEAECVDYLVKIEADHMGLGATQATHDRAIEAVRAIRDYLATLPEGPLGLRG